MKGCLITGGPWWKLIPSHYQGMALFPFVLVRSPNPSDRLLRHERIHLQQQLELAVLPFYLWYLVEYFWFRLQGYSHQRAYRKIRFEREAFACDDDPGYLHHRSLWAFMSFAG